MTDSLSRKTALRRTTTVEWKMVDWTWYFFSCFWGDDGEIEFLIASVYFDSNLTNFPVLDLIVDNIDL